MRGEGRIDASPGRAKAAASAPETGERDGFERPADGVFGRYAATEACSGWAGSRRIR